MTLAIILALTVAAGSTLLLYAACVVAGSEED